MLLNDPDFKQVKQLYKERFKNKQERKYTKLTIKQFRCNYTYLKSFTTKDLAIELPNQYYDYSPRYYCLKNRGDLDQWIIIAGKYVKAKENCGYKFDANTIKSLMRDVDLDSKSYDDLKAMGINLEPVLGVF